MLLNRRALSGYDDKRWICDDGVETRALGHWRDRPDDMAESKVEEFAWESKTDE
jgi:hypothetical protein